MKYKSITVGITACQTKYAEVALVTINVIDLRIWKFLIK